MTNFFFLIQWIAPKAAPAPAKVAAPAKTAAPAKAKAAAPKAAAPAPVVPEVEDVDDEVVADLYGKEHINVVFMGHVGKWTKQKFSWLVLIAVSIYFFCTV